MALKEDVLAALAAVKSPDGAPLTETGKLSDVVASDGKVFFSITVDAGVVPQWEPVRKAAEAAVRAVPGVKSAMVALTGERAAGLAAPRRRPRGRPEATDMVTHTRRAASGRCRARPALARSSRSRPARAASASRPPRSISRSGCAISA